MNRIPSQLLCGLLMLLPPMAASAETTAWALIGGGGATQEEAQRWIDQKKASVGLHDMFHFAKDFPRVVKSEEYPGLKPGFFIALLAICSAHDKDVLLPLMKTVDAGVYAREVKVSDGNMSCPEEAAPVAELVVAPGSTIRAYKFRAPFVGLDLEHARVVLEDASGKVVDAWTPPKGALDLGEESPLEQFSKTTLATGCGYEFKPAAGKLLIEQDCMYGHHAAGVADRQSASYEATTRDGKLVVTRVSKSKKTHHEWE
ncbi:hypothetical protein [Vitiosangium sp. GDMCC 1.1324]|uniref:hypothetical protein n=1 Tax=Vitiosangium sp. (strain GDMCC 1.1324) TaxID=2138576 RepID=UPI000D34F173|nr:hypothetical protein [Vitiosangium sp. GDMCC 1.1324]PTL81249.1 hypothetical protein DAT35_24330 [Vitiosangium sp. GDMCC 1.1324]